MKKILTVILSMLILVLSAVSCTDQDNFAIGQSQTVVLQVDQSSGYVFDICNPFFFCHTGHSAFVKSDVAFMKFTSTRVLLISETPVFVDIPVYSLIWHPPKA